MLGGGTVVGQGEGGKRGRRWRKGKKEGRKEGKECVERIRTWEVIIPRYSIEKVWSRISLSLSYIHTQAKQYIHIPK